MAGDSDGDHPRSRGVYPTTCHPHGRLPGSSPLARGLRHAYHVSATRNWIIPARAGFTRRPGRRRTRLPDHPRSRGVYWRSIRPSARLAGSSPLARGLLLGYVWEDGEAGIIPARAGFTFALVWRGFRRRDHPRSRGVYPRQIRGDGRVPRIIPARAGFTRRHAGGSRARPDHPRSRGVYRGPAGRRPGPPGSSPLARGLPTRLTGGDGAIGIIPARAGFTSGSTAATAAAVGSSPLARGLRDGVGHRRRQRGIIPARAGFTRPVSRPPHPGGDHPRSRGVYGVDWQEVPGCRGSSPLARGLHTPQFWVDSAARIIPARAGFTTIYWAVDREARDHPRSRGVYHPHNSGDVQGTGSSPLARGLPAGLTRLGGGHRIIPARAGFTSRERPGAVRPADHPRSRGVYPLPARTASAASGSSPLARGLPARLGL